MGIRLSNALRMGVVGEKVYLPEPFQEFWIVPRKHTVAENDQIRQKQLEMRKQMNVKALASAYAKVEDIQESGDVSNTEALQLLEPDEIASLIDTQSVPMEQAVRLEIRYGIAETNLAVDDVTGEPAKGCSQELEDAIVANPDLASLVANVVQEYNRPLAPRNAKTSPTSPSGPTGQPGSTGTTSSLTEGSQQS